MAPTLSNYDTSMIHGYCRSHLSQRKEQRKLILLGEAEKNNSEIYGELTPQRGPQEKQVITRKVRMKRY